MVSRLPFRASPLKWPEGGAKKIKIGLYHSLSLVSEERLERPSAPDFTQNNMRYILAASSHDLGLVPTNSITLYTLSAMVTPFFLTAGCAKDRGQGTHYSPGPTFDRTLHGLPPGLRSSAFQRLVPSLGFRSLSKDTQSVNSTLVAGYHARRMGNMGFFRYLGIKAAAPNLRWSRPPYHNFIKTCRSCLGCIAFLAPRWIQPRAMR